MPPPDRPAGGARSRRPRESIRRAAESASDAEWAPVGDESRTEAWGSGYDPNRTLGEWLESVIPPEAQVHFINAGREFAAGVQTTVDHHLGRRRGEEGPGGPVRIEIE